VAQMWTRSRLMKTPVQLLRRRATARTHALASADRVVLRHRSRERRDRRGDSSVSPPLCRLLLVGRSRSRRTDFGRDPL
jgi:hypothetical protein